ncbi:MAG: hypothetical protein AAGN82_15800 [Myxococcota bacterium]
MKNERHTANPGYAFGQLEKALATAVEHPDAKTRERALVKANTWRAVLAGMADGTLTVGSRVPLADTPAWVTLEVAHGGFATGRYLAEGELREHERERLAELAADAPGRSDRERLNLFFASDRGLAQLRDAMATGRCEVDIPEEAALPVALWLADNGHGEAALDLLTELWPLMHRLRFYPRLTETPRASGAGVHLVTTAFVRESLSATKPSQEVQLMNKTLAVWNPLYDALVGLWLTTVEGPAPAFQKRNGILIRADDGQPIAEGGWPCRVWPGGWAEQRDLWLAQYQAAVDEHGASGRHHADKSNFQLLRKLLEACPSDAAALSEASVGAVRQALAAHAHRHDAPSSEASQTRRAEQARIAALPLHRDIAAVVAKRLAALPQDDGLADLSVASADVGEGEHPSVPAGTQVPTRFVAKVARALLAPIDELVARGIVRSAEVLAIVLPQLTSQIAAAGIEDPVCRDLFARTYAAFRRRRSLLLLNLEHQVQLEELPWVAALGGLRQNDIASTHLAAQSFRELALLTLEHFPHTIIPNPLLREFSALAKKANIDVPFVEEIAADIFMGTFTKKFSDAAALSSRLMEGTLYARYYDLPPSQAYPAASSHGGFTRWGKKTHPVFDSLCASRSAEAGTGGGYVAKNGAMLEQMQVLTTYNLASLVVGLDLSGELRQRGAHLASKALRWAFARQTRLPEDVMPRRRTIKNTAYAWRQAVFFLSFVDERRQRGVLADLFGEFAAEDPETFVRLKPAFAGLKAVVGGARFGLTGRGRNGERRLLGWALGQHWALPGEPKATCTLDKNC